MRAPLALAGLVLLLAGCLAPPGGEPLAKGVERDEEREARSHPPWADPSEALIRPGTPIHTEKRDCPTNFVFTRADNNSIFLGTTAFCVRDLPIGAFATVGGPEELAILIYSSWETMGVVKETDPDAREYNDFALFRIDPDSRHLVNPTLPEVGGPTGLADPSALSVGTRLREHAEGPARVLGRDPVAWREAIVTGHAGEWALLAHSPSPALPGTTGGAVVDAEGRGVGLVVNVGVFPNPGANGIARLDAVMAYAKEHARLDLRLATP